MTKRVFGVLALAALFGAVAAPLPAQSFRLTATIPFEFTVGNATMPAGDYSVMSLSTAKVIEIRNENTHAAAAALANSAYSGVSSKADAPRLVFSRYGEHYVLSQIWDGSEAGRELPKTRTERELAKTASVTRLEILAMLMPR